MFLVNEFFSSGPRRTEEIQLPRIEFSFREIIYFACAVARSQISNASASRWSFSRVQSSKTRNLPRTARPEVVFSPADESRDKTIDDDDVVPPRNIIERGLKRRRKRSVLECTSAYSLRYSRRYPFGRPVKTHVGRWNLFPPRLALE